MKNYYLALICLVFASTTFAQVKVRPGIKAGLNSATITNIENATRKIGFQGAIFVNIHFSKVYELQVEASYSNQGFKRDNFTIINPNDGQLLAVNAKDINIHYIGAAVSNKFFFIPDSGFHVLVGPSLEINMSDSSDNDILGVDLSFFAGIGYELPIGLGFEARYKQGLVDVRNLFYNGDFIDPGYNNGYNGSNYYDDMKLNSVIQLSVYYKFNF
ncbi:outer membrane beta-barrel protein [Bizionia myxarmorum]|uniref:PorT family protein n=1 Tax=Bizionia myxarmorum TaxID=291186 RepID=A0A5D0RCF0_9FLAO|nr:outer membrane beta-barrel protein [Bizionia myxarmorum]TYB78596.1 PorT family protein [Bizionia myxarmorum]